MMLDITIGSKAVWRILILMSESPGGGLTREEIRRYTMLGNRAITLALESMARSGLITETRERKRIYKMNLSSKFAEEIISLCRKERESLNNLPFRLSLPLREFSRQVAGTMPVEKILLFGSVAKRTYREDSDMDLAIITREKPSTDQELSVSEIAEKVRKRFGRKTQVHYFTSDEFEKGKRSIRLIMEILKDGISLL